MSSSKKRILEQNQIFKKSKWVPMYFFKNSKKKKKSRELFFTKWKEKMCLKVKPLEKKGQNQIFQKT